MRRFILLLIVLLPVSAGAQKNTLQFTHVEPPFWWTGMKKNSFQILFHNQGQDLDKYQIELKYDGASIESVKFVENPHYAFVTVVLSPGIKAGVLPFTFTAGKKKLVYNYELKEKNDAQVRAQGFSSSDVLYLVMPDRFSNGDIKNDSIAGMFESTHRNNPLARHGGDLKGIENHLDYVSNLGVTALWLNPVLENNQKTASYHGYAITDLYRVDRRFGSNADYVNFISKCHQRGLKVIQDMVMNHIGNQHWLFTDPPDKTWIHNFPEFTRSNYRSSVVADPYQADEDAVKMNNGWFDTTMPDIDQTNPLFATYLIQNSLWWIQYAGIDGIRMDTYPYNEKQFMALWAKEVRDEYPTFGLVGEVWINNVGATAYWQDNMPNKDGYRSFLPSTTDFPLYFAMTAAVNEKGGWDSGLTKLYEVLSLDFLYPNPFNNLVFLDNHDLSRWYFSCGKDLRKFKLGIAFLLTTRGIPQLYYGSELLMEGDGAHHPQVRLDFPGGWPGDSVNAFSKEGRTKDQNEAFDYIQRLLQWRKNEPVIHTGKLTHYIPEDNVYVYFRSNDSKTVMVIMNGNDKDITLSTARYRDNLKNKTAGFDVLTKTTIDDLTNLRVGAYTALVIELK